MAKQKYQSSGLEWIKTEITKMIRMIKKYIEEKMNI